MMDRFETIRIVIDGPIARLTLNRPDRLNSFSPDMTRELREAFKMLADQTKVRGLLIAGEGRAFCAGQDLQQRRNVAEGAAVDLEESLNAGLNQVILSIKALPYPVVSSVRGVAAGAGVSLALAADICLAAEDARFLLSFSNVGLGPDAGLSWALPQLVGRAQALGHMMMGSGWTGKEAVASGLIFRSVPEPELDAESEKLVATLATRPTVAMVSARRLVDGGVGVVLQQHLAAEAKAQGACGNTEDYRRGLRAFFAKETAVFEGN